jgi:hypothetical protein
VNFSHLSFLKCKFDNLIASHAFRSASDQVKHKRGMGNLVINYYNNEEKRERERERERDLYLINTLLYFKACWLLGLVDLR